MPDELYFLFGAFVVLGALALATIAALLCEHLEKPSPDEERRCACAPRPATPRPATPTACPLDWQTCLDCGTIAPQRSMVPDTSDPDRLGFLCAACLRKRPLRRPEEMNV